MIACQKDDVLPLSSALGPLKDERCSNGRFGDGESQAQPNSAG